jgi:hypothetical protein
MMCHLTLLTKWAYQEGWAAYRSALSLTDEEVLCLTVNAEDRGPLYYDAWRQGWADAAEADDTLMD